MAMTRQVLDNWSSNTDESGYLITTPTYVRTYVAVWEEYCTQDQDGHSMPDIHSCTDMYPLLRSSKLSRPRTCVVCQGS